MIGCGNKLCPACKCSLAYEEVDIKSVQKILQRIGNLNGKMIDGGAHVGVWSLNMIKWYQTIRFPFPKIVAIEPNRKTASILMRNLDGTHASTVILEAALWKDNSDLKLRSGRTPAQDWVHKRGTIGVKAITLDEIFENIGEVDLIKLDVEGTESEVIEGGEKLFKSGGTRLLITEFSANRFKQNRLDPFSIVDRLESFGYRPWRNDIAMVQAAADGIVHCYNVRFVQSEVGRRLEEAAGRPE